MPKPKNNDATKSKKATLEEKARKAAGDATVDAIIEADADELRTKLTSLAKHEKETEDAKEADEAIKNLQTELTEVKGPYADTLKSIALQRKLIASRLEDMGK